MSSNPQFFHGPPRATALAALAVLLSAGCSSTPVVIPTKNLDRPTDMAFVCLAMVTDESGQTVLSGQAMAACHPEASLDPATWVSGQRALGTFGFVPNAGRGELAVADMDQNRLLDLMPQAPGYGMLPVGTDPEAVASSQDGCWLLTANRTGCDLTLIDPSRLLATDFAGNRTTVTPATGGGDASRRLAVKTGSGTPLRTTVGEVAFLPPQGSAPLCRAGAASRVVATFPGCDLVALLDLSFDDATATIADAYYVRPDLPGGFQPAGREPVCPVACGAPPPAQGAADGGGVDGGQSDGGATPNGALPARAHVQALAVVPGATRIYVAGLFDTAVTSFDIADAGLGNPLRTELAEAPRGVSRLRLAVDPFASTTIARPDGTTAVVAGRLLGNRGTFLYAIAADDSIRVLNLDGPFPVECDVNIVLAADDIARRTAPCLPVGTPGRRPLVRGPGLRIPVFGNADSPPPLPRDIAFAELQPSAGNTNYHALSGQFGFVLAASGQVYVLNLAPNGEDGRTAIPDSSCASHLPAGSTLLPATTTHSFRDQRDIGQCTRTPLTVSIAPQRQVLPTDQAFPTTATFSSLEGPRIKSFSLDGGVTTSWFDFPDSDTVVSQQWDVVWEGALPGSTRASGLVGRGEGASAGKLTDAGAEFCASTVRPGDVLMFSGCSQNVECQPDDQFSCQVTVSGGRGTCLPIDKSTANALLSEQGCARFLGSRMRYEVARATPTELTLRLKLDEVPKTTLNPCVTDADCKHDVDHGRGINPTGDPSKAGKRPFQCVEVLPDDRRCVQACVADGDCRAGHMCEQVAWVTADLEAATGRQKLCVQAPPITPACLPQPMTTYSVRAGHSFLITGGSMPNLHTGSVGPDGTCQYPPPDAASLVNRIPLSAPRCPDEFLAPAAQGTSFVQQLAAQAGANPCLYRGAYRDGDSTGSTGAGPGEGPVSVFFENAQLRFVLTNLDAYAGDLLAIHFDLQNGFEPLVAKIQNTYEVMLTLGTRIITGPTKTPESPLRQGGSTAYPYLYVVDQGRTALTPGSRGQVLRINPRSGDNEEVFFDTTYSGSTPFQLQ